MIGFEDDTTKDKISKNTSTNIDSSYQNGTAQKDEEETKLLITTDDKFKNTTNKFMESTQNTFYQDIQSHPSSPQRKRSSVHQT